MFLNTFVQAFIFKISYYLNLSHITYSISENAQVQILKGVLLPLVAAATAQLQLSIQASSQQSKLSLRL